METVKHSNAPYDPLPDLPNYDPEPADGVNVGESPVLGLTLRRILRGHTDIITRIAWSPDGRFLASPSFDTTIRIWDVARGECAAVLEGHQGAVYTVVWSPDGHRLASGGKDGIVRIWNSENGELLAQLHHEYAVWGASMARSRTKACIIRRRGQDQTMGCIQVRRDLLCECMRCDYCLEFGVVRRSSDPGIWVSKWVNSTMGLPTDSKRLIDRPRGKGCTGSDVDAQCTNPSVVFLGRYYSNMGIRHWSTHTNS